MEFRPADLRTVEAIPSTEEMPAIGLGSYIRNYLTPPQIATAYGIPKSTGYGIKIGIFSFGGGFYQTDLDKSFTDLQAAGLLDSSLTVPTIRQVLLNGQSGSYTSDVDASGENTVDIYCAACMAPQASITLYIGSSYASMLTAAIADGMNIITISWCGNESTSREPYFAQAADAKIAVLAASGDWGSTLGTGGTTLIACYPASSPYVMSVGGTKLTLTSSDQRLTESDDNRDPAWGSTWGGGGGLSTLFSLPSWQTGLYYTPIINGTIGSPTPLTTRGAPDISAPMNTYIHYDNGTIVGSGGTSLSSPVLAGILARYTELTGIKRSSPEWNAIAYSNPSAFYDITVGTNNTVITSGYAGTSGWDCVTGLGPPIGASIYKIIRASTAFPKKNYGFRPTTGPVFPRAKVKSRVRV
jgi:kumamolisin